MKTWWQIKVILMCTKCANACPEPWLFPFSILIVPLPYYQTPHLAIHLAFHVSFTIQQPRALCLNYCSLDSKKQRTNFVYVSILRIREEILQTKNYTGGGGAAKMHAVQLESRKCESRKCIFSVNKRLHGESCRCFSFRESEQEWRRGRE